MKFNKKQKKIMRGGALILFSIALVLILKSVFNINISNNDNNNSYIGTWYIGYRFYEGNNRDKIVSAFSQKLTLFNDNTFIVKEIEAIEDNDTSVSGSYEIKDNNITLKYTQNGNEKEVTYYFEKNKMCMDDECDKYYLKDKLEYFEEFNTEAETVDE